MRRNTIKKCDFMSILRNKTLREYKKPTVKIGDRLRFSKYELPCGKGYNPQCTRKVFEFVAKATRKPTTYTIKDERDENIQGNFYQKELFKIT